MRNYELHYKDDAPQNTIKRIKHILEKLESKVDEFWAPTSSINTFSLRIQIRGTQIGANGKGVTREYATASAYAELIERVQNLHFIGYGLGATNKSSSEEFIVAPDEININKEDLIQTNFFRMICPEGETERLCIALSKLEEETYGNRHSFLSLPFFDIDSLAAVPLPYNLYRFIYGSNGMSAGNTIEEAIVQAISEIMERYVQNEIITKRLSMPDIPLEFIAKYGEVAERLKKISTNRRYYCVLKDCSLGGVYPVVGLLIFDRETGHYGIKLGCHPDCAIAMERTLTEATQGQDIEKFSNLNTLDFTNCFVNEDFNLSNISKCSKGYYPFEFFELPSSYPFALASSEKQGSNREMLRHLIEKMLDLGHNILIRNVSFLGFPSVHVIIPQMSEMYMPSATRFERIYQKCAAISILRNPALLSNKGIQMITDNMKYFSNYILENTIESYFPWYDEIDLPCANINCGCEYFIAMAEYYKGNYQCAASMLRRIASFCGSRYSQQRLVLDAMNHLMQALEIKKNYDEALDIISYFYDNNVIGYVKKMMCDVNSLFSNQYPTMEAHCSSHNDFPLDMQGILHDNIKHMQSSHKIAQSELRSLFEYRDGSF